MEVEWIREDQRFSEIAVEWEELASLEPDPFLRYAWVSAWWSEFGSGPDDDVRVCAVWREAELVAGIPLQVRGDRALTLAKEHTVPFRLLARDERSLATLVEALLEMPVNEIVMPAILLGDERTVALRALACSARRLVLSEAPGRFPRIDAVGGFAEYRARMKSRWGSIERKGRKLRREHDARTVLLGVPGDLDTELDAGLALEARGWKGRAGSAAAQSAADVRFLRSVAHGFATTGSTRISLLWLGEDLVAWDLAILHQACLYSLNTTYDERYARLSPGLVLRREMIERCFELGLKAHDLGGTDLEWKRRFATSAHANATLRIYRVRPRPFARFVYRRWIRPCLTSVRNVMAQERKAREPRWPPTPLSD